jgi:hypothetical protein
LRYSRLLDRLVTEDSRSWALNQYDLGSMRNATVERTVNGKTVLVKGYYTYNQGKPGWVEAQLINGRLSCLHYWDRVDCRQLGQGLGKQLEDEARYEASHPAQRTESAPDTHQEPWPGYCDSAWQSKSMFWGLAGCGQ